ncbi:MAG TPA: VOC family protein [Candidatus Micrarchaeia archaeon]|nr:VOC family protein [Candidatus Micrarchaeia archaeon]
MITRLGFATVYVLDQDAAKAFYVDRLGFVVTSDVTLDGGFRWLTVAPSGGGTALILIEPGPPMFDPESAQSLRALIAKGALGPGVLHTDDCRASHRELAARGVTFLQEPAERPYGLEAVLRDDSGNWFSLTERPG